MTTAKKRYDALLGARAVFLHEAKKSADLTIPSLFPSQSDFRVIRNRKRISPPWQSMGARGVNNLASRLVLALFPPGLPFFRFEPAASLFSGLPPDEAAELESAIQQRLAARELTIQQDQEASSSRTILYEAIRHLLVTGNSMLFLPPERGISLFPLNQYVVRRDGEGSILELVYVEALDRETAPESIRGAVPEKKNQPTFVYTWAKREGDEFTVRQELENGTVVPDSEGSADAEVPPWIVLRYTPVDNESYGRSFVEEYRGDLAGLDSISKSLQQAAANAGRILPMVRPNSTVSIKSILKAENGEPIHGDENDVSFLRVDKGSDFNFANNVRISLMEQLSRDFMLVSSVQRSGERVTAEEIRRLAEELEDTLGGVFSALAQDLQLPLAKRRERQLEQRGELERLPEDVVQPVVVTGIAALGRSQKVQSIRRLMSMFAEAEQVVPGITRFLNRGELARQLGLGSGVKTDGLLKTEDEVQQELQQEQEAQQQAQLAQQVTESGLAGAAPELGRAVAQNLTGRGNQDGRGQ